MQKSDHVSRGRYAQSRMVGVVGRLLQAGDCDLDDIAREYGLTIERLAQWRDRAHQVALIALAEDVQVPSPQSLRDVSARIDEALARLAVVRAAWTCAIDSLDKSVADSLESVLMSRTEWIQNFVANVDELAVSHELVVSELAGLTGKGPIARTPRDLPEDLRPMAPVKRKPGPKPKVEDAELDAFIGSLGLPPETGCLTVQAYLRQKNVVASQKRVLAALSRLRKSP